MSTKATKATKDTKSKQQIPKYRLERREVMKAKKPKTSSGLTMDQLMYTGGSNGKTRTIVSKARHENAKNNPKLQQWLAHVMEVYQRIKPTGGSYGQAMVIAKKTYKRGQ